MVAVAQLVGMGLAVEAPLRGVATLAALVVQFVGRAHVLAEVLAVAGLLGLARWAELLAEEEDVGEVGVVLLRGEE